MSWSVASRSRHAAAALAAAAALGGIATAALGPRYGGAITVAVLDLPAPAAPGPAQSLADRALAALVHEPLLDVGPDGVPVPALVRRWSLGANGREWTLQLAAGITFHDDRPVTAEDLARGVRRFLRSPSPAAARLAATLDGGAAFRARASEALAGVAVADPQRIVLRFTDVFASPLAPLASTAAAPTSAAGAGCGPFVPTVHVPGRSVSVTAFAGHVRGRPYLDRVELVAVPDADAAREGLQAGRVDLGPGTGGPAALAATLLLVLDPSRAPFDQPQARAAVAAALDRVDLVRHFLPGGDPAASLVPGVLLAPLGLDTPPAPGALAGAATMVVDRDVPPAVSQRMSAVLGGLGLKLTVVPATAAAARAMPAPARLLLWSPEVPEAGLALEELASMTTAPDDARALLAAALRETGLDRRRIVLHRAEAALRAYGALVPLASAPVSFGVRRGLHDARVDLAGRLRLEDAWLEP